MIVQELKWINLNSVLKDDRGSVNICAETILGEATSKQAGFKVESSQIYRRNQKKVAVVTNIKPAVEGYKISGRQRSMFSKS